MAKRSGLSLFSHGINYKLKIAFCLMAVLPLLVSCYFVSNYIFSVFGIKPEIIISIAISSFLVIGGFLLLRQVINRIVSVSAQAKLIASGDFGREIKTAGEDEVGELERALNQLTIRIRSNMEELKNYGEKTAAINLEIQTRVLVLSNLLQLSSLISQGAKLDDILKTTVEKARLLADSDVAYLLLKNQERNGFFMKAADGINSNSLLGLSIERGQNLFACLINKEQAFLIDKENILPEELNLEFQKRFALINALMIPIYLRGNVIAVLGIGNSKETFRYRKDDAELLDIFAKQVAIAVDNDILMRQVERLEIKDPLTGLFNETFICNRLDEEIKRAIACRRPCAFILLQIDNFLLLREKFGLLYIESILKKTAFLIKDSIPEIGRAARFREDKFAVVLPEYNKRQTLEIAENIRKKIEFSFNEEHDINKRLTVSGAVSENPLDGVEAKDLIAKAESMVNSLEPDFRNRITI